MAEPGPAADHTVALNASETMGVPTPIPPDAVVDLAWSSQDNHHLDEDLPPRPATVHESWRTAWGRAGGLLMIGLGLAGVIVLGDWGLTATRVPSKDVPSAAPPTTSASAAAASSSITSTPDQDGEYLQALNHRGISFADPQAAVYNGKTVCQNIGHGMTVQQVTTAFQASSPAFSDHAEAFVGISVRAYCPQHSNLVAGF